MERLKYTARAFRGDRVYDNYQANPAGKHPDDWVEVQPIMPSDKRRSGWTTQKPPNLYIRFIAASSNSNDLVLDPFAGCGTTCAMAEKLGRRWVGVDIDPAAEQETISRLEKDTDLFRAGKEVKINIRKSSPRRTDIPLVSDEQMRKSLWAMQGRKCANPYCDSEGLRVVDLELDHRIPKSRGGADELTNRIGLCANCNRRKSRKAWGLFLDEECTKLKWLPKTGQPES